MTFNCVKESKMLYGGGGNGGGSAEDLEVAQITGSNFTLEKIHENDDDDDVDENGVKNNNEDGDDDDDDDEVVIVSATSTVNTEDIDLLKSISSKSLDVLCNINENNLNEIKPDLNLIKSIRSVQSRNYPVKRSMRTIENAVSSIKHKLKHSVRRNMQQQQHQQRRLLTRQRGGQQQQQQRKCQRTLCGRIIKSKVSRFLKYPLMVSGFVGTIAASSYLTSGISHPLLASTALTFNSIANVLNNFEWSMLF